MPKIESSAGTIEYEDTGGNGPVLVLLHGLAMNGSLWGACGRRPAGRPPLHRADPAAGRTPPPDAPRRRPLASRDCPARGGVPGEARSERSDPGRQRLGWGAVARLRGARQACGGLVLASCEAFDNYPPGLPGRAVAQAASVPGGIYVAFRALRLRPLRRLPLTWGWMSKRPLPDEVMDEWFRPLQTQAEVRRDLRKYALSIPPKKVLLRWSERLHSFDRPALIVWAVEDRVMPREHGRWLAELFPQGRLVEIPDSYTLIPEDQPGALARAIRGFIQDTS